MDNFHLYLQSAALGGAAHLVNFCSTDTVAGLLMAQRYYGCPMAGFSIPAAEHRYNTTQKYKSWMRQCITMFAVTK